MVLFVGDSPSSLKRRKFASSPTPTMPSQELGRDFRVYASSSPPPAPLFRCEGDGEDDDDDFYEFTAEDYCRLLDARRQDGLLKAQGFRDADDLGQRQSTIPKAVIRVRFPDNNTLEVAFRSLEKIQCLIDFLMQVVARPDLPFYLYTTPPKKRVKDLSQDFYSAGFVPGAILHFSYDLPQGHETSAAFSIPFLRPEILSLKHLDGISATLEPGQIAPQRIPAALFSVALPSKTS